MKYKYIVLFTLVLLGFSRCVFIKNTSQKIKTTVTTLIQKLDRKKNKIDTVSVDVNKITDTSKQVFNETITIDSTKTVPIVTDTIKTEIVDTTETITELIETPIDSTITENTTPERIAHPLREFRAAWVASVGNINWPSKPGLTSDEQKAEATAILNYLSENKFNAVILQVRPQADALYASEIEPWSYFLTGQQDKAPDPFYDPLNFWIEEAHKRGIELHAWMNPYRAHAPSGKEISNKSIVKTNPETVVWLKEGYWWMDPSLKATQDRTTSVVLDVVKRYDIDGIHFDDYFYPYPSFNNGEDFPDNKSWKLYLESGGKLSRSDWRRASVNTLIERLYKEIKAEKKHVKFGLSPFGIWRPGYPSSIEGFDQYEKLYADAKLWLNKGWIDYFSPQLYWPTTRLSVSFPLLLGWWQEENTHQRHLWPGINIATDKNGSANNQEIISEIMIARAMVPKSPGVIHWSMNSLTNNPSLTKEIKEGVYKKPALVPASHWLNKTLPKAPEVLIGNQGDSLLIKWSSKENDIFKWVLYYQYENKWEHQIFNREEKETILKLFNNKLSKQAKLKYIIVTAVDRTGNESAQKPIAIN